MRIIIPLLSVLLALETAAQKPARLQVWLDPMTESMMLERGLEMDHGIIKKGVFIISDYTTEERAWLDKAGINYDVLIDDISTYYRTRALTPEAARGSRSNCENNTTDTISVPGGFSLGSMGGFYTYDEFLSHLDAMAAAFPNLITVKAPIDTFLTHQGRPVYWLKISDNPDSDETEPELLYTGLHHAREPQSLTQLIFYMYYLLENYGTNAEVTHLVDNSEMYFVPMLNPDGYVRNQDTDPDGGGLWRKNRRNNGDATFGVDLNRNYGHNWGYDNLGSSPDTESDTYRGPAAFSEPETRAIKWFCEHHEFGLALNYHAFGNYMIYPWGFQPSPLTPDSVEFIAFAQALTEMNNYTYGTGFETVAYPTNGDSDDWMYGEQGTKNKIFSMTPEIGNGGDGFWPASDRIIPLSKENLKPNLLLAHFAGNYMDVRDNTPQILSSLTGNITLSLTRLGLSFDVAHSVGLIASTANVASVGATIPVTSIALGESQAITIPYTLNSGISPGETVEFDVYVTMGSYSYSKRIRKIYGQPTMALSENGDFTDFTSFGWGLTNEDYYSPSISIADSPYDFYENANVSELVYGRVIDLRQSVKGLLQFRAKWAIEAGWDFCQVMASPVDEENWSPLCGLYTHAGTEYQDEGQPVWDGFQNTWIAEQIMLDDYIGQRIKIKFRLVSDQFVNYDGFYLDDLQFMTLLDQNSTIPLDTGYIDSLVSIAKITGDPSAWKVFPNPAGNEINVRFSGPSGGDLIMFDVNGRQVLQKRLEQLSSIDVSSLESGLYIIEIKSAKGLRRERISIIH